MPAVSPSTTTTITTVTTPTAATVAMIMRAIAANNSKDPTLAEFAQLSRKQQRAVYARLHDECDHLEAAIAYKKRVLRPVLELSPHEYARLSTGNHSADFEKLYPDFVEFLSLVKNPSMVEPSVHRYLCDYVREINERVRQRGVRLTCRLPSCPTTRLY